MPDRNEDSWDGIPRPSPRGLVPAAWAACARALEAEADRWFLWLPVLFAAGILAYFALPFEPPSRVAAAGMLAALGLLLTVRHAPLGLALGGALLAFGLGFADAKLRTETVRAPVLQEELRHVSVAGYVEDFERRNGKRDRLTLRVVAIGDLSAKERPYRVRISTAAKNTSATTGEAVQVRATLNPPPEPIEPGGFDFARQAWFKRLGASGYATGRISPVEAAPTPWDLRIWGAIDALRLGVNDRIHAVLPGATGAIAIALITGERGGIPQTVTEAMRDAGLAHVLAISGLHMMIMAGTVFWLARALLALIPGLALRYPIKKWAAAIAILAATFYLALSGASVPTVRAWIMMSIFLIAVMLDRPAITMRNVALAALAILIVAPESLFQPSFEMSFAAVIGLVAVYEWLANRKRPGLPEASPLWRGFRWGGAFVFGAGLTTLIAGTAVAPFAVYHFHRMTHFGLVANLVAAPLVSLLVMPMALLALIAMPFGLEAWPLYAMGYKIDLMVGAAHRVASWPGAVSILPRISGTALALIVLGGLWLCLWGTRIRALGLVIVAAGLALAPADQRPDVLIEREGATAALRGSHGDLIFPPATAAAYSVENWLLADGDDRDAGDLDTSVLPESSLPLRSSRLHRPCEGKDRGPRARRRRAGRRLPCGRHRHRALHDRRTLPRRACHRRPAHVEREGGPCPLYRRSLRAYRDGRASTRQPTLGPGPRCYPKRFRRVENLVAPDEPHEPPLDAHAVRAEDPGFVRGVGRFQGNRVAPAAQTLQRGFLLVHQRHDDIAIGSVITLANDDGVAFEDPGIDHGVALHLERIMLALGQQLRRDLDRGQAGLDRLHRHARGDPAHDGYSHGLRHSLAFGNLRHAAQAPLDHAWREATRAGGKPLRYGVGQADDFHGTGAVGQAADKAALLQRRDQPMNPGLRLEIEGLLHLVERGWHPRLLQPLMDEHEKLFLLQCEHLVPFERSGLGPVSPKTILAPPVQIMNSINVLVVFRKPNRHGSFVARVFLVCLLA